MMIRNLIKRIVPEFIVNIVKKKTMNNALKNWEKQGKPIPPPHKVKQLAIEDYQKKIGSNILVETGTYMGDMVYAMKDKFKKIYSIELGTDLWKSAVHRFRHHDHISIIQGDSGKVLFDIVPKIKESAIFWLDGHYSGGPTAKGEKDCPIFEELTTILDSKFKHVLLIDDARYFNGSGDYPTVEELSKFILGKRTRSKIEVKDDIIRIVTG